MKIIINSDFRDLFCLEHKRAQIYCFGKLSPSSAREYNNLIFLENSSSKINSFFPKALGLLNTSHSLLLLSEYAESFTNLSVILSKLIFPDRNRTQKIINIGKLVLRNLNSLQRHSFEIHLGSIEKGTVETLEKLKEIRKLSDPIKQNLIKKINNSLNIIPHASKGLSHGDLGSRNILLKKSKVFFVDWEYMKKDGFLFYDPCTFITYLVMRCVQLHISSKEVCCIEKILYNYLNETQNGLAKQGQLYDNEDILNLGKCNSKIETLFEYEKQLKTGALSNFLKQRKRQISYLTYSIEKDIIEQR